MTTFDDRDKGFESKFAHDEELSFKATSLCNRMLGMWAAAKMGKTDAEAEHYARSIIEAGFADTTPSGLEARLIEDLAKAGISVTPKELHKEVARIMPIAIKQVMGITN
jgi:hypothetical protein